MTRQTFVFAASTAACVLLQAACGSDAPTNTSPTITAPTPQTPANGSTVSGQTPSLTVVNATGASGLRYRFEVASDSGFSNIVASADNLPEGTGTTSWVVAPALASGTFHWRSRASAEGANGPFSTATNFEIESGFNSDKPVDDILVFDPLTNGMSVGAVSGGEFRSGGWFTTNADSAIRYRIPTTVNGFVEFDVKGLRNPNPNSNKRNLMIMWDPSRGDYTENPFRVHIAKFDTNLVNRWHMRLRFISNGQEANTGINKFDWDPNRTYHFRLEWGSFPAIVSSQRARVILDGREIMARNYDNLYRPSTHWVELGMAPRSETLEQVTYSNVTIGVRRP